MSDDQGSKSVSQGVESFRVAWKSYGAGDRASAESSFRQVVSNDPQSVDGYYSLGLALKAQGKKDDALQAFEKAVELIDAGALHDPIRATMLRRIAHGQINFLKKGDWDLEAEIWKRVE